MLVKYKDYEGYAWLVNVDDTTMPEDYDKGIIVGPPPLLTCIDLDEDELKVLQEALVDAYLVNAAYINGSADKLYNVVKNALPNKNTRQLVREIKSVYQLDYYNEV